MYGAKIQCIKFAVESLYIDNHQCLDNNKGDSFIAGVYNCDARTSKFYLSFRRTRGGFPDLLKESK